MLDINAIDFSKPLDETTLAALHAAGWKDDEIRQIATEARALEDAQMEAERASVPGPADVLSSKRAERVRLEDRKKARAERVKAEATWSKDCVGMLETRVGCFVMRGALLKEELEMMEALKHAGVEVEIDADGQPKMSTGDLSEDARVEIQDALLGLVVYPKRERVNELVEKHPALLDALAELKQELRGRVLDVAEKKG